MTTYKVQTQSGHTIILHGGITALTSYESEVNRGEAEAIDTVEHLDLRTVDGKAEHAYVWEQGQCYGRPCSMREPISAAGRKSS